MYFHSGWAMPYPMQMQDQYSTDPSAAQFGLAATSKDISNHSNSQSGSSQISVVRDQSSSPPNLVPNSSSESEN